MHSDIHPNWAVWGVGYTGSNVKRGETWKMMLHSGDQGRYQQWWVTLMVCTFDMMWLKWHSGVFLSKTHNPSLIMKSTGQIQDDLGILQKIPDQYCSKLLSSSKSRDIQDIVKAKKRLRDMMTKCCVSWMGAYNKNYSKI